MITDDVKLVSNAFCDALQQVIKTCTGFELEIDYLDDENKFSEVIGAMSLIGNKNGMLFISGKESDIQILNSYMTGSLNNDVTKEDINDTLCEIVNMTAGSAKLRLGNSEYLFNLTSPYILRGQNIQISTKKRVGIITKVLSGDSISLRMMIVL